MTSWCSQGPDTPGEARSQPNPEGHGGGILSLRRVVKSEEKRAVEAPRAWGGRALLSLAGRGVQRRGAALGAGKVYT